VWIVDNVKNNNLRGRGLLFMLRILSDERCLGWREWWAQLQLSPSQTSWQQTVHVCRRSLWGGVFLLCRLQLL